MAAVVSLSSLLQDRRLWRGKPAELPANAEATGHALLDAVLPGGGWPEAALIEVLMAADGVGELRLLLPTLARLTQSDRDIALIAPPYVPFPAAWAAAGIDFRRVQIIDADHKQALWASEQCLRSGCLSAVLCWPQQVDDRALRRLQVAAESGRALGFAFRDLRAACNPSPAVLRLQLQDEQIRVLKCRGALPPARAIPFPHSSH